MEYGFELEYKSWRLENKKWKHLKQIWVGPADLWHTGPYNVVSDYGNENSS